MTLPEIGSVERVLTGLGSTAEEVAESLDQCAATGFPSYVRSCPVSVFLHRTYGVTVRTLSTSAVLGDVLTDSLFVILPYPVAAFVERFDRGEFPELDEDQAPRLLAQSLADETELPVSVPHPRLLATAAAG